MELVSGWLSPTGELYKCGYETHMNGAIEIVNEKYSEEFKACAPDYHYNEDYFLFSRGYIEFGFNGVCFPHSKDLKAIGISPKQLEFIIDNSYRFNENQSADVTEGLKRIEMYKKHNMMHKPDSI